ncbi:hypothetical protein MXD62_20530 [Frankia sp. Mgl5]|uniref:hypothetical protein n=1 Tax=Frankia sp. Mgl5 TaxID=2933793 RepID=UPI00200FB024|nr:hypothetical protein [Frankia sp. Mgl5]MCK9929538.1 hypothetical protein [Frankia sp. Mgl5]
MLDVEVPAGVDPAGGRAARPGAAAWTQQQRPLLVAASFVVAVVLGVVIGLVWASDDSATPGAVAVEQPDNAILSPPLPSVPWETSRVAGRARTLALKGNEPTTLRQPLMWLAAYEVRKETGAATPVASDVTIPNGMFYGAVEGVDKERDEFWAVGMTEIRGVTEADAPDPHVWKRVGSAPWTLVGRGTAACDLIPAELKNIWGPSACSSA